MHKNKSTDEELLLETDLVPDNWDDLPDLEIFDDEELSFIKHHNKEQQPDSGDDLLLDELDELDELDDIIDDDLLNDLHTDNHTEELELSLEDDLLIDDELLHADFDELNAIEETSASLTQDQDDHHQAEKTSVEFSDLKTTEQLDAVELNELELELPTSSAHTIDKLAQQHNLSAGTSSTTDKTSSGINNQQLMNSLDSLAVQLNQLTQVVSALLQQKHQTEPAQVNVQKLFSTGVYYAKHADYIHAAKWFRRAAMASHGKAMFYLGMMFIKGEGLPKSIIHSYVWMSLANVYGVSEAKAAMLDIQHRLTAHELNQAQRLAAEKYEEIENAQAKLALHIPTENREN